MAEGARKRGGSEEFVYDTGDSSLGRLLVAATDHGVCYVNVDKNDRKLEDSLRKEYPKVRFVRNGKANRFLDEVTRYLDGQEVDLPLDLRGTDFQLKVWKALQRIPVGETRSYSEVAERIGKPRAVRAVANACATNPIPFIVPCHRVVRKDGSMGGYGGGLPMKRTMLSNERARVGKKRTR